MKWRVMLGKRGRTAMRTKGERTPSEAELDQTKQQLQGKEKTNSPKLNPEEERKVEGDGKENEEGGRAIKLWSDQTDRTNVRGKGKKLLLKNNPAR